MSHLDNYACYVFISQLNCCIISPHIVKTHTLMKHTFISCMYPSKPAPAPLGAGAGAGFEGTERAGTRSDGRRIHRAGTARDGCGEDRASDNPSTPSPVLFHASPASACPSCRRRCTGPGPAPRSAWWCAPWPACPTSRGTSPGPS